MGAPRYGISLRVEHEKRIARCIGAKAQDGKMRWNNTKTNNGRNFQYAKFSIIDLVLTDRRTLSGTRPKSACGISTSCPFSFSALRSAITKANEYVTIGFTFRILVFSPFEESLNVTHCEWYGFLSVLAAIYQKTNSEKWPWIENSEGSTIHSSAWSRGGRGEWRVRSWFAISNRQENIRYSLKFKKELFNIFFFWGITLRVNRWLFNKFNHKNDNFLDWDWLHQ